MDDQGSDSRTIMITVPQVKKQEGDWSGCPTGWSPPSPTLLPTALGCLALAGVVHFLSRAPRLPRADEVSPDAVCTLLYSFHMPGSVLAGTGTPGD